VLPGRPVPLVLALIVVLTCGRDLLSVANVCQRSSASDGLVAAWGGLLTAWPDAALQSRSGLSAGVGRCH
jgi:hypothetical protein